MTSPLPVGATPATGGSLPGPTGLPPKLLDDAAQRMSILAVFLAVVVVIVQVFQRFIQPQLAAVIDDPVNRLATLAAVLMAIGSVCAAALPARHVAHAARARHAVRGRRRVRDFDDRDLAAVRSRGAAAGPVGARSLDRVRRRLDSEPPDRDARSSRSRRPRAGRSPT